MKKIYVILILIAAHFYVQGQNITELEYFIDTDPGFGGATNIAITPSPALSDFTFNVPLSDVQDGFHTLFVRVKNSNDKWSYIQRSPFVKLAVPANISRVEYFVDTDPGNGNGTEVAFTNGTSLTNLTFEIPLSTLSEGLHTLYVRIKEEDNKWSSVLSKSFLKIPVPPNITYVEYYIDTDPGHGNGVSVPITPAVTITDLNFEVDVSGLSMGDHTLYVRAKNSNDRWSISYSEVFSVCDITAPIVNEATDVTANSFTISWSEVPGATSYIVEVSKDDFTTFVWATVNDTDVEGTDFEANTSYKARVRAVGACTSENSNIVSFTTKSCNVPPKPVITVSSDHTGTPALVSNSSFGNRWYRNDILLEETSTTLTVNEPGIYKVQVVDGECVSEFSDEIVIVISALGPTALSEITLYPNPAQDRVTLAGLVNLTKYKLTDTAGREQRVEIHSEGGQYFANVQHLSSGAYLLLLNDGNSVRHISFLKK